MDDKFYPPPPPPPVEKAVYHPLYQLAYITPQAEQQKARQLNGSAFLDFPVNKTDIRPDYRRNATELARVVATIEQVRADQYATITHVSIHGYASPEGSYANNTRLAEGRAQAFAAYVSSLIQLPQQVVTVQSTPEDWQSLRAALTGTPAAATAITVPGGFAAGAVTPILAIIDDPSLAPDEKERRLKARHPAEWRLMLDSIFPALRHSDYEVAYTIRPFTVEEACRIIRLLDNTNPTTYFQRYIPTNGANDIYYWFDLYSSQTASTDKYRFIGSTTIPYVAAGSNKYRIYWGISTNYDGSQTLTKTNNVDDIDGDLGEGKPQYCYENTFDVAHQKEQHTTRALLKLEINGGKDFYMINNAYYGDASGSEDPVKQAIINILVAHPDIAAAMKAVDINFTSPTVANSTITLDKSIATWVEIKWGDGDIVLSDGTHTLTLNSTLRSLADDLINIAAAPNRIQYYKDGAAYYQVLIKHFGDDLTPWNSVDHLTSASAYADDDAYGSEYLGRYSVLRNNWYNIEVQKVYNIGSPVIPEPGDSWDDGVKSYMGVDIHIFSWAYRNQPVTL